MSRGPKSAGRARKKVELSSVRLMIAAGGKRVDGVWKEKKDRKTPRWLGAVSVSDSCPGCARSSEQNVKNVGKATMARRMRTGRAGGMVAWASWANQAAAAVTGNARLVASECRDFAHDCQQLSSRSRSE